MSLCQIFYTTLAGNFLYPEHQITQPVHLNASICLPHSTNTTEYDTTNYSEMYDYDFNSTCDQDVSAALSDSAMVLYYMLFALGLLGRNKNDSKFP